MSQNKVQPQQFRKKPVVVEAVQLTEQVALDCLNSKREFWPGTLLSVSGSWHPEDNTLSYAYICVDTLEGQMRADVGDWIIKGIAGEFYPCKPDIFAQTYSPANQDPAPLSTLEREVQEKWDALNDECHCNDENFYQCNNCKHMESFRYFISFNAVRIAEALVKRLPKEEK